MATFERFITAGQAVIDVLKQMGLTAPSVVSSSQDPTVVQMWALVKECGQELLDEHDWQMLMREQQLSVSSASPSYALPDDFHRYIEDSAWNRTTRLPAIGTLRKYEWAMLQARNIAGTTFAMLFRVDQGEIFFYESPTSAQDIRLPYLSRAWIVSAAGQKRDNPTADDDVVRYDPQLFKAKLKLRWLAEKKFDTTRQQDVYDDLLEKVKGRDSGPGRTLSLNRNAGGFLYLGYLNIPDTGYGST